MPSSAHFSVVAVLLTVAACTVMAGMDSFAKFLALEAPVLLVVWGRYFFHTVITFAYYRATTGSLEFVRARRPGLQFIRALMLLGTTISMYFAITVMPLGDAASIQFLAPVLLTAFSGVFLSEHVGPRRWVAVLFGFLGVLLVARPGSGVFGWHALLPLATAFFLAAYMMMTRSIRDKDNPDATTFYSTALGALVLTGVAFFYWQPLSTVQWICMVAMGTCGAVGHFLLVKAFHRAEASMLAPFTYTQVVAAILFGYLFFAETPSTWTLSGASIVIASGVYIWYRETRVAGAIVREEPNQAVEVDKN